MNNIKISSNTKCMKINKERERGRRIVKEEEGHTCMDSV